MTSSEVPSLEPEGPSHGPSRKRRSKRIVTTVGLTLVVPGAAILASSGQIANDGVTTNSSSSPEREASKADYLDSLAGAAAGGDSPNVLLVYYDDLGYGDLGFMGDTPIRTPNLDSLARDGVVLTNYHAPSAVCTPSRAAMLTGRLAPRAAMPEVIFPTGSALAEVEDLGGSAGLTAAEITIADVLQASGYATGMIGKWHLGDTDGSLPNDFGFDAFLGSLYSNDMSPFHIYRDKELLVGDVDQSTLDELYTNEAVSFIGAAADGDSPFFLYFAHNFPHEPLVASDGNAGTSDAGLYGDVVEGLDDGIGRIVAELDATGQLDNTIIIVTSDNGPWFQGDPGDHRGRKGLINEGGMRVPFLIHWPDHIEGGQTLDAMAMGTDLLPTLMEWLDIGAPTDRVLDGTSMAPLLQGESDRVSEYYYYYAGDELIAVSDGRYKYYTSHSYIYATSDAATAVGQTQGPWLFDLEIDPSESYDVSARHPEVAAALATELERRNTEMADNPRGWLD